MAVHQFAPSVYHNTIGSHEPVLHIADGDSVVTTTVDARGMNVHGEQVAHRGNPMTGPFYIDGAEPGDCLAVTFDSLRPNRRHGWTATLVAPNVVEPAYVRQLPTRENSDLETWEVDVERRTATLVTAGTDLPDLTVPMAPMLGCFGVAPERGQAISTATSAQHGGNMDYRGFTEGVTVYLPVFVPGALFHLGDGHAVQGDGEIVGTGVEISFDVQFTVRLRKGWTIYWPRAETSDEILTVGNARPLDQALQHATTEMMRWLEADYGLKARAASALLGQAVRYEIGNVFDPAYTVVCKLDKRLLPRR